MNLPERLARSDLQYFSEYLGYTNAPFHNDWYRLLQPSNDGEHFSPLRHHPLARKRYHVEWPRGHAKTETTSINYVTWLLGGNRDLHINLVSKTANLSESINTAIMTRLEADPRYRRVFGNLKPATPRKWTSQQFIVERPTIDKNPSVKATGLMGPITGGRSDLIVCDDIIDEENVRTPLQLEKVDTWFNKVLIPTLYPWGGILVIGTRWHYADIYAHLLDTWPHDVRQAILNEDTHTVLWPDYWPYEKLVARRNEIGSIFFNCQYQNDPTGMEGDLLCAEWLHPWDAPPSHRCEYYAGLDPSLGEADYFGIATVAYDRAIHAYYLVDVWAEHLPFPDILNTKIPLLNNQYHYVKMYMEANFWQRLLFDMPEFKGLPIVPVQTVRDKTSRFISMSSHFQSGRVLVNPLLLRRSEFWTEWVQYPRGSHDDALDATDLVLSRLIRPPPTGQPPALLI